MDFVTLPKHLDCISGRDLFIPISLGNHYYSSRILRYLLIEFVGRSRSSVFFLCDRLRFLAYQIKGEGDIEQINSRITIQLDQMTRALIKVGLASHSNVTVGNWSFLRDDARYPAVLLELQKLAKADCSVGRELDRYASMLAQRFGPNSFPAANAAELQSRYIIEETALCLYMTEIRGFSIEVYRRGTGFVDYLYAEKGDKLKDFMSTNILKRKFISIEEWLAGRPDAGLVGGL